MQRIYRDFLLDFSFRVSARLACAKSTGVVEKHVLLGWGQQAMDTVPPPGPAVGRPNPSVQVIELKLFRERVISE